MSWYYIKSGFASDEQVGPISDEHFRALCGSATIGTGTLVCHHQLTEGQWQKASDVPFFVAIHHELSNAERVREDEELAARLAYKSRQQAERSKQKASKQQQRQRQRQERQNRAVEAERAFHERERENAGLKATVRALALTCFVLTWLMPLFGAFSTFAFIVVTIASAFTYFMSHAIGLRWPPIIAGMSWLVALLLFVSIVL